MNKILLEGLCGSFSYRKNASIYNILNGQTVSNIPSEVTYNGTTYNIEEYNNFLITSDGQSIDFCFFKDDVVYLTFQSANIFLD